LARFLALDWDHQQLQVVLATIKKGIVRIERAVSWQVDKSPNPADAEALGRLLRDHLDGAGIAAAPVLACVGRERVVLKELRHPAVKPEEEPALIRFQAIKELTEHPDEVVIDYAPSGETGGNGERRALVLALRRELLTTYQTLCKSAGLKVLALCPRPFATAVCLHRLASAAPEAGDTAVAVLTVAGGWAEFCVVRGERLLFARALAAPALTSDAAMLGEIRRNLAVYAGQASHLPVRALYIAGGDGTLLRQRLQETLAIPVHVLDPFAGDQRPEVPADNRGAFAGAVGLLHAQAQRNELPINFVQPKQPKPVRDPNQNRILVGVAAAVLLLIGGGVFCYALIAARDNELANLAIQQADLDRRLAQTDAELNQLKALDEWDSKGIVWLDELYDLTDRLPEGNALRVTILGGDPLDTRGQSTYVAKMTLDMNSREINTVYDLIRQLNETNSPYRAHTATQKGQSRFNQEYTARVDVRKRLPSEYVRKLSAAPPPVAQPGPDFDPAAGFGIEGGQP
jgi:Tfp pilus assembly PilM family ATPase